MTNIANHVRNLRLDLGWSQAALAKRAGVSQSTVDKIERGVTDRSRFLTEILRELHEASPEGTRTTPLAAYERQPFMGPTVQVFAAIAESDGSLHLSKEALSSVTRPSFLSSEGYALSIPTADMSPEYEPGDIALVDPLVPPGENMTCLFFPDQKRERAFLRRLVGSFNKKWIVRRWAGGENSYLMQSDWPIAQRIVGRYVRI
jgi:transcriptional regulator with XRE-family HTH domain